MILNLLVLAVLVLLTLYLSTQGLLSALLSLITASFASILAMALFEFAPLENLCGNYRPEFARGVTFLILFFLALSGIRIGADYAVPKNIVLPTWIDRISGGVVGFFAAMMVVGTTVIGVEMLPLPTSILMYDRFPAATKAEGVAPTRDRMQTVREEGGKVVDVPGVVAAPTALWSPIFVAPDRFVLGIWDLASGRSLGGPVAFGARHPDLSVESYGYRNVVQTGAGHALLESMVRVTGAYRAKEPGDLVRFKLADSHYQALVIRTEIDQGTDQPRISADADGLFRITPTQIRLVTDKGNQYYPIGYLEDGTSFRHTSLGSGYLVDDYGIPDPPATPKLVHDWVFPMLEDEKPRLLEIKQLARFDAADVPALADVDKSPRLKPAVAGYPPHVAAKNPATFTLFLETINADKTRAPLPKADVYIVQSTVEKRDIEGKFNVAYSKMLAIISQWEKNQGGWGDQIAGKTGAPEKYLIQNWINRSINEISNTAQDKRIQWTALVPVLLHGELTPDGARNLGLANKCFDETVVPLLKDGKVFMKSGETGPDGKFKVTLTKGVYTYIVRAKSGDFVGVWCGDIAAEPKANVEARRDTSSADFKVDMRIQK